MGNEKLQQQLAAFGKPEDFWQGFVVSNEVLLKVRPLPPNISNGLKFELKFDKTRVTMGPDGLVKGIPFSAIFTNVSNKPIRLNTYQLAEFGGLRLQIEDPQGGWYADIGGFARANDIPPLLARDLPLLGPGQSHKVRFAEGFPGWFNTTTYYYIAKPGRYRIKAVYSNRINKGAPVIPAGFTRESIPLFKECWQGKSRNSIHGFFSTRGRRGVT